MLGFGTFGINVIEGGYCEILFQLEIALMELEGHQTQGEFLETSDSPGLIIPS